MGGGQVVAKSALPPAVSRLIDLALEEDLGRGDVTSAAIFDPEESAAAVIVAKSDLHLSGLDVCEEVFLRVDRGISMRALRQDGDALARGTLVMELRGPVVSLLQAERSALNFLQRLSGIATLTSRFVEAVAGTGAVIVDTRKTAPGFRFLDKRAVRHGGGRNHRADLGSGILIKDNHVAASGGVGEAIRRARAHAPHSLRIEVEVTTLAQIEEALAERADILLLDNMSPTEVAEALALLPPRGDPQRPLVEVSGGVTLESVARYAQEGVDLISVGALTHSAAAADFSMEVLLSGGDLPVPHSPGPERLP